MCENYIGYLMIGRKPLLFPYVKRKLTSVNTETIEGFSVSRKVNSLFDRILIEMVPGVSANKLCAVQWGLQTRFLLFSKLLRNAGL